MTSDTLERRVLVLAPVGRDGRLAAEVLSHSGIAAEAVHDMAVLCREAERGAGALLLTEESLDPASLDGLLGTLALQPAWSDMPIIVLTLGAESSSRGLHAIQSLHPAGAPTLLERPVRLLTLVSSVRAALRSRHRQYEVRDHLHARERAQRELAELNHTLEARVLERTERLREINRQLEAFSYQVSHNLKAPLRAVHDYAEALIEDCGGGLDPRGLDYAERLQEASERMATIIRDLLAYSLLSRTELIPDRVPLAGVVHAALVTEERDLQERGAHVDVDVPEALAVFASGAVLAQAVANLLSNAVKFVPVGRTPALVVRAVSHGDRVRLTIEDNGIGIAAEHFERIFSPFERLHGNEEFPGTGVGLAMVKTAVERMGGSVGVDSATGRGSRFWLELVRAEDIRPPDPLPGNAGARAGQAPAGAVRRVPSDASRPASGLRRPGSRGPDGGAAREASGRFARDIDASFADPEGLAPLA